jgi:hypothetical protein
MFTDSRGTRHAAIVNTPLLLREVIAVVDLSMHYIVVQHDAANTCRATLRRPRGGAGGTAAGMGCRCGPAPQTGQVVDAIGTCLAAGLESLTAIETVRMPLS